MAAWLRSSRRFDRRHGHRTLSRTGDPQSEVRLIHTEGRNGEHRSFIQPLAVSAEGGRVPTLERKGIDLLRRQPGPATLSLGQRRELLHDIIEPMVQRELNHRGLVPENGGYSAKLIGWVEIGERERS